MSAIVEDYRKILSFEKVELVIRTEERTFTKHVSMQDGLSSLMGIVMATSGCPVLDYLRPMVFTHLPFSTGEETAYRVLSMYALGQYYRQKAGLEPDWTLKKLLSIYDRISKINTAFIERFRNDGNSADAHLNAIVKLNCFSIYAVSSIEDEMFVDLSRLFAVYLRDGDRN